MCPAASFSLDFVSGAPVVEVVAQVQEHEVVDHPELPSRVTAEVASTQELSVLCVPKSAMMVAEPFDHGPRSFGNRCYDNTVSEGVQISCETPPTKAASPALSGSTSILDTPLSDRPADWRTIRIKEIS